MAESKTLFISSNLDASDPPLMKSRKKITGSLLSRSLTIFTNNVCNNKVFPQPDDPVINYSKQDFFVFFNTDLSFSEIS